MKVSEIASKCGVSEQSIRAYYQREQVTKIGGRWQPTDEELDTLFPYYGVTQFAQENASENNEMQGNESLLAMLENQLDILKEQLKAKDSQIGELQNTISKQQETISELVETNKALAASNAVQIAADKKPLLVEARGTTKDADSSRDVNEKEQEPQKNRGFWALLFDF
ncbi:MAG: DUF5320 domain-containing protein [Eggerthellaceae bacterium]|nr:DUF5320 domain-containing protein [Eggerthellaceae bacterium]